MHIGPKPKGNYPSVLSKLPVLQGARRLPNSLGCARDEYGNDSLNTISVSLLCPFVTIFLLLHHVGDIRHLGVVYERCRCLRSNITLSNEYTLSNMTSGCYRILCVSNNDEIEGPLMIPTTKVNKWVAAQIIGRLQDGSEISKVCMRGERGLKKSFSAETAGAFICPDVDAVCYGRPCLNGGVVSFGV